MKPWDWEKDEHEMLVKINEELRCIIERKEARNVILRKTLYILMRAFEQLALS